SLIRSFSCPKAGGEADKRAARTAMIDLCVMQSPQRALRGSQGMRCPASKLLHRGSSKSMFKNHLSVQCLERLQIDQLGKPERNASAHPAWRTLLPWLPQGQERPEHDPLAGLRE